MINLTELERLEKVAELLRNYDYHDLGSPQMEVADGFINSLDIVWLGGNGNNIQRTQIIISMASVYDCYIDGVSKGLAVVMAK